MKMKITVNGQAYHVEVEALDDATPMPSPPSPPGPPSPSSPSAAVSGGAVPVASTGEEVKSPIAGSVLSLCVKSGDVVKVNDPLLVLEAMKMESNVASPAAGTVSEVCVKEGDAVQAGQVLVKL